MTVTRSIFATGFSDGAQVGLCRDSNGYLYSCSNAGTTLWKIATDGSYSSFATLPANCSWLCIDSSNVIYALDASTIYQIAADGTVTTYVDSLADVTGGICVDAGGNLYYGYRYASQYAAIGKIDTSKNVGIYVTLNNVTGNNSVKSLTIDASGNIYAGCFSGYIAKVDTTPNATLLVNGLSVDVWGITLYGGYVYATGLPDHLYQITLAGGSTSIYTDSNDGYQLLHDSSGNFYQAGVNSTTGVVYKFVITTTTNNHAKKSALAMSGH